MNLNFRNYIKLNYFFPLFFLGVLFFYAYENYKAYIHDREIIDISRSLKNIILNLQKERLYTLIISYEGKKSTYLGKYKRLIKKTNKDIYSLNSYFEYSTRKEALDETITSFFRGRDILYDIRDKVLNSNSFSSERIINFYTSQIYNLLKLLSELKFSIYSANVLKTYNFINLFLFHKESLDQKNLAYVDALFSKNINKTKLLLLNGKCLSSLELLKLEDNDKFLEKIQILSKDIDPYLNHIENKILNKNFKTIFIPAYIDLIEKKDKTFNKVLKDIYKNLYKTLNKEYAYKFLCLSFVIFLFVILLLINFIWGLILEKRMKFYISEFKFILNKITSGDFTQKLHRISKDELGEIALKINKILLLLEASLKKLKESTLKEKIMVAAMSHEIKNTLNATIGYLELLELSTKLDDREKLFLKNALEACKLSLENLEEILDYHKITLGKANLEYEPVNLEELVKEAVSLSSVKIKPSHIKIKNKDLDKIPIIYAPKKKLLQILINLITNAIKYTFQGYVEIGVKDFKKIDSENAILTLYVKDTGIGIPDRIKNKIFKVPFLRENLDTKLPSTGLGLYITKKFVDFIKGKIYFESQKGQGTTFYVEVPVKLVSPSQKEKNIKFLKNEEKRSIKKTSSNELT